MGMINPEDTQAVLIKNQYSIEGIQLPLLSASDNILQMPKIQLRQKTNIHYNYCSQCLVSHKVTMTECAGCHKKNIPHIVSDRLSKKHFQPTHCLLCLMKQNYGI